MAKRRLIYAIVCVAVVFTFLSAPRVTHSLSLIRLTRIVGIIKDVGSVLRTIRNVSRSLDAWVPHSFPFGGHIETSERACEISFTAWIWVTNPACLIGFCFPPTIPIPWDIDIPLGGRAISSGPPVPTPGKVITFPFISDIYRNYSQNRVGPWDLGLGFTPFPLDELNRALEGIEIGIPPSPTDCPGGPIEPFGKICLNNFEFECVTSGDTDRNGRPIYKVILKLGTGP